MLPKIDRQFCFAGTSQSIEVLSVFPRFRDSRRLIAKFLMHGIYPERFSKEYGEGGFANSVAAFGRTLPMSLGGSVDRRRGAWHSTM
ncbi:hypothetical protein [Burkholderia stagnalis]|uniref:hypothetical protein n=1 Tax=Burkholderia stagnalis TaxID=1503054 RepID=UPI0018C6E029|nr:hypothetical protein [Burkholderia stagnalis]